MIEDLRIRNFKGIKRCITNDLSRINLLIGKNNCCKSTILEAIYYTLREFGGQSELSKMLARRSNVYSGAQELWFNYHTNRPIETRFCLGDIKLGLNLLFAESSSEILSQKVICGIEENKEKIIEGAHYSRDLEVTRNVSFTFNSLEEQVSSINPDVEKFVGGIALLEGTSKNDVDSIEKALGLLKNKRARSREFGKYMNDVFGVSKKWEFVPQLNKPKEFHAAFYNKAIPLFLNGFGDGIRYAIQLIAKAMLTRDSLLLIEELETSQHAESLKKLVPLLVRLSFENNIQVFVTTQNPQVWRLFEHEFDDSKTRQKSFRAFLVRRDKASGVVELFPQTSKNANDFWVSVDKELSGG